MGLAVAIESCTIIATVGDEAQTGTFTIVTSGLSVKSKVVGSKVCLTGLQVQATGMSGSAGSQSAPAVFSFTATATKDKFDGKYPLLVNDVSQPTTVNFVQGQTTTPIPVTLQIIDAGQTKVKAS